MITTVVLLQPNSGFLNDVLNYKCNIVYGAAGRVAETGIAELKCQMGGLMTL